MFPGLSIHYTLQFTSLVCVLSALAIPVTSNTTTCDAVELNVCMACQGSRLTDNEMTRMCEHGLLPFSIFLMSEDGSMHVLLPSSASFPLVAAESHQWKRGGMCKQARGDESAQLWMVTRGEVLCEEVCGLDGMRCGHPCAAPHLAESCGYYRHCVEVRHSFLPRLFPDLPSRVFKSCSFQAPFGCSASQSPYAVVYGEKYCSMSSTPRASGLLSEEGRAWRDWVRGCLQDMLADHLQQEQGMRSETSRRSGSDFEKACLSLQEKAHALHERYPCIGSLSNPQFLLERDMIANIFSNRCYIDCGACELCDADLLAMWDIMVDWELLSDSYFWKDIGSIARYLACTTRLPSILSKVRTASFHGDLVSLQTLPSLSSPSMFFVNSSSGRGCGAD